MNIDDSGSSNTKDSSRYYVLTGTIIDEKDYKDVKQEIFQYKLKHFKNDYVDGEVHVHELYKSKPPFSSLLKMEKYNLKKLFNKKAHHEFSQLDPFSI